VKVGKRAMRESDLLGFEIALKGSNAGAVMCAYNL
jgi:beta-glucosidase-like glycosyl hydrolase